MATVICNEMNQNNPNICQKTFLNTLAKSNNVDSKAVPCHKAESKDDTSPDWAVLARTVMVEQMTEHFKLGEEIDKGKITRANCELMPLHDDVIIYYADKTCVQQTIGGNGHTSSFSNHYITFYQSI
jgi:hypothetical protein